MTLEKVYLGDGVYAWYDGYHIVLSTDPSITIYLDSHVWAQLKQAAIAHGWNEDAPFEAGE